MGCWIIGHYWGLDHSHWWLVLNSWRGESERDSQEYQRKLMTDEGFVF